LKVGVVGGGWAGLAAAVRAVQAGHDVSLFEMAPQLGGRARGVQVDGLQLDNGQHILIGAYQSTLALMQTVGADAPALLDRRPLELRFADGRGLRMPGGPPWLGFGLAVLQCRGWTARDRLSLLRAAAGWAIAGFQCPPSWTVAELCRPLTPGVMALLIEPLCVAALNTPARDASASVLLRVLKDALFGPAGSADLLLPRGSLDALLPVPAAQWLRGAGAHVAPGTRIERVDRTELGWQLDGRPQDAVILACTATEAARLSAPHDAAWAAQARGLDYEPIVTVYIDCPGARLPAPMTALLEGPQAPAQHAFDLGVLGGEPGRFAFVVSGARAWVDVGLDVTGDATLDQARAVLVKAPCSAAPTVLKVLAEKRATFRCTPGLQRPRARIAPRLIAAGDYVEGPYPATLEGAVRAGEAAVRLLD
jgi:squalene-associated FAD-dependent desaturase